METINQQLLCHHFCSMLQLHFLCGYTAFVCHRDEPDFFSILHPRKCLRNNLIIGKTGRSGTNWRDVQFLEQESTCGCARPKGCPCSAQLNHTREVPLLPFGLCWKCSSCAVYKEIHTQRIAWGTPWARSLKRIILLPFLITSIYCHNTAWLWHVLLFVKIEDLEIFYPI